MSCLKERKSIQNNSSVIALSPILNNDGLMSVGGRLGKSDLPLIEKHPVLIPGKSHVAKLIVLHYHTKVCHQGRHFTEGAIRDDGYWVTGCKRLVSSVIHKCVICRKLRGKLSFQRMANLPEERLTPGPPFSQVGVDCFGPWQVSARRTRGGIAQSKRWGVLFTCLSSRAIHIEVVEELSTSSFTPPIHCY
ncbi:uncharacterized protein LOC117105950 [Anneissia japonica]|uniref:uncharacterized protein LOC117105950 n=1 Tax=Anneissia japonica TaxID=1529436 RepID=UPI001425AD02|nr:uncharacterized protein LOC117105950 [Anneissia japonica]